MPLGIFLEIAEPVIARNRGAMHLSRIYRTASAHRVEHPPVIPNHHIGRFPLMEIGLSFGPNLLGNLLKQRIAFGIFNTDRHPRRYVQDLLAGLPRPDSRVNCARELSSLVEDIS